MVVARNVFFYGEILKPGGWLTALPKWYLVAKSSQLTGLLITYIIQVQLKRAGLSSALVSPPSYGDGANAAPLVRALLLQIGETLSVWSRPAATAATLDGDPGMTPFCPPGLTSKESLSSAEEAVALAGAHVGLLRALLAKEGWSAPLMDCLREARGCFKCFFRFEGLHNLWLRGTRWLL